MTKTQKLLAYPALGLTFLAGGALAGAATLASAQTASTGGGAPAEMHGMRGPHVHGTVSAISGAVITVNDAMSGTTYSIDASGATFKKFARGQAPVTQTLSDIQVGDEIGAIGTLSGTTLTATEVFEGRPAGMGGRGPGHGLMGTVTAVNGSTVTMTGPDGKTYTVNAGSASVHRITTGSLGDVQIGDRIGVHGDVSGTTVSAKDIMDDLPAPPAQPN